MDRHTKDHYVVIIKLYKLGESFAKIIRKVHKILDIHILIYDFSASVD